jgi:hypothetical protein
MNVDRVFRAVKEKWQRPAFTESTASLAALNKRRKRRMMRKERIFRGTRPSGRKDWLLEHSFCERI